ncbi:MAG: hypothetical protein M3Q97_08030, partial [Bacteroidota bacterium]|nr:hypothetical protein [Bacteroidota bacterium]
MMLSARQLTAQETYYPAGSPVYRYLERLELKSGSLKNDIFLDSRQIGRSQAFEFIQSLDSIDKTTRGDSFIINYILQQSKPSFHPSQTSAMPALKYFYTSKANFFEVETPGFNLYVNPVLAFSYGFQSPSVDRPLFRNTRGLELRGDIDNKIGFYSYITENQFGVPEYITNYADSLSGFPGEGYIKVYKNTPGSYDYFNARAYITASISKHIGIQFGHDRNFIGPGHRTLLLSDNAADYPFLRINTQVWRLRYQNLFTKFTDFRQNINPYPPKFGVFHYLSFDAAKWMNIGIFEGVLFHNSGKGFELSYLNPVIFYRFAEQQLGSADNAVAGATFTALPFKGFKFYGELLLDEFKISELRSRNGWWGNKF